MSARDLAIALLLGDGGGNYDKNFHELLENTTIYFEQALDSTYTVKFGLWRQQGRFGNPSAFTNRAYMVPYIGNYGSKKCALLECEYKHLLTPVYIVYKNGTPLYAFPHANGNYQECAPIDYSSAHRQVGDTVMDVFYPNSVLVGIENITVNISGFSIPTYNGAPTGQFYAIGGYAVTYRYNEYTDHDSYTENPYVVYLGERTETESNALTNGNSTYITGCNYDFENTYYTDLSNDEMYDEFQNVYNSLFTALGIETYPIEILPLPTT